MLLFFSALVSLTFSGFSLPAQASPVAQFWEETPNSGILSHELPPGNYLPPGRPPSPLVGHKPSYLTIFTEADITFCRPYPTNSIATQNAVHFFRGTPLNLTCWSHNDVPGAHSVQSGQSGQSLSQNNEIWVRTEGNGCYINENDLRSTTEINYEEFLNVCERYGPQPLGGNNPLSPTNSQAVQGPTPPPPLAPKPPVPPNPFGGPPLSTTASWGESSRVTSSSLSTLAPTQGNSTSAATEKTPMSPRPFGGPPLPIPSSISTASPAQGPGPVQRNSTSRTGLMPPAKTALPVKLFM